MILGQLLIHRDRMVVFVAQEVDEKDQPPSGLPNWDSLWPKIVQVLRAGYAKQGESFEEEDFSMEDMTVCEVRPFSLDDRCTVLVSTPYLAGVVVR